MTAPYISLETSYSIINCEEAFKGLLSSTQDSMYAYHFLRASWSGAKICFFQRSYESPALLYILLKGFGTTPAEEIFNKMKNTLGEDQCKKIFIYLSAFLDNCGNYKSFGDSKFIPQCSKENFRKFWLLTQYWSANGEQFQNIYARIQKYIFAYEEPYGLINFANKNGTTGYYSANVDEEDAEKVKTVTVKKGFMSENNRLVKDNHDMYTIKVAAVQSKQQSWEPQDHDKLIITVKYGQFSPFLRDVNASLAKAKQFANEMQAKMITQYIEHFKTGDMEKHKQSQRYWIQDKQPVVQTNIGFIESYLDPLKIRAQFQGFVCVVNKKQSIILGKLVEGADKTLKYLPWGSNFQVDQFKKPDFTSLQVLGFGSSGIPVGINIPNYHDIREKLGFKNVNLGNAYGQPTVKSIQYCPQTQIQTHLKYYKPSLFVIVALHELLGHGSGKLLTSKPQFKNPIDGSEITTFYQPNQTWHSVFGDIASTYQQCKADSVALYLACFQDIQEVLLPDNTPEERWQIVEVAWFDLIVGGLRGMQYFDPKGKKWMQAHIGASFAIFKVLQQAGGIFEIKETQRDGKEYLQIHLDKKSIRDKGKEAIGKFLTHLQVYKSTANLKTGKAYFEKYLQMDEQLLKYRQIVLKNKRPRRLTVQPDVKLVDGKLQYIQFPANSFGCIDSGVSHFSDNLEDIIGEWEKNNQQFCY